MTSNNFEFEMTSQETDYSVDRGGSRIFLGRGGFAEYQGGGGGAHPLHPPSRSPPGKLLQDVIVVSCINLINLWNVF